MPTSLDQLLPAPEDAPRCVDHARSIAVDPGGSAIRADRVVLVAVPLPWPKPALDHPLLIDLCPLFAASETPTRLLATMPSGEAGGTTNVTVYDRDGGSAIERRYQVDSPEALLALGTALSRSAFGACDRWLVTPSAPAAAALLICTQGSHDVCCGSEGVRLATEVADALDIEVFRVSHTGGHRFAPTAMTLPDGRMWSDLDLDALRRILAEAGSAADLADLVERCRGWWGADTGPAQVAERAVLGELGWALNREQREVTVDEPGPDGTRRCAVKTATALYEVTVGEGRAVPSIACRQPGGLPAKQAQEYEVRSITRTR